MQQHHSHVRRSYLKYLKYEVSVEPPLWRVQYTFFLYFSVRVFKQEIQKERVKFGSKFVEGTENKLRLMGEKSCCIQARMGIIITQGRTKKMRPNIRIGIKSVNKNIQNSNLCM